MNKGQKLFLYTLFFLSGVCGLVYEVVWSRQFLLIFGNTTYSVVGVITSFILGLGIGNYLLGRYADQSTKLVSLYALLEVFVGVFALTTLYSIPIISSFFTYLVQSYSFTSESLIIVKFFLSSLVLFPATICMGGTLPILIRYFSKESPQLSATVGRLYFINTLGAFCGALASGFILIELFGLRGSIIFTAVVNICIGYLAYSYQMNNKITFVDNKKRIVSSISPYKKLILLTFLISGMTSFVYQVLWVRILTPSTGTYIFAFSIILAIFLLGIALGSYMYEKYYSQNKENLFLLGVLQIFIMLFTASSVFVNTIPLGLGTLYKLCLTIIPATICMGMTFPVVSSLVAHKDNVGEAVGTSYLYNTIGNVLGAYVSAFILLPFVGTAKGILICSVINFCIGMILIIKARSSSSKTYPLFAGTAIASVFLVTIILNQPYQLFLPSPLKSLFEQSVSLGGYTYKYYEDNVASVFAYTNIDNSDQNLIIDGVETTYFGTETSILSHLPLFVHPDPSNVLVIALGMGRTFRSALLHDVSSVDVVELVPSVLTMLPLFHSDDSEFLNDRRGTVIINDGRNFLETSTKKYDVIIVDAPPPVNAAGTTVLYSKEFYEAGKERMNANGIFTVWFYSETKVDDFKMLLRSFYEVFPHVLVIRAKSNLGYYILGSESDLSWDKEILRRAFEREEILSDINKNQKEEDRITSSDILENFVGEEDVLKKFTDGALPVTDDYPRTEYFLLRYITSPSLNMTNTYLE